MNQNNNHEMLSAYLDGELSSVERAEVEKQLDSSPALRCDLDALKQVSELVVSLPKRTAPSTMIDSVLEQIQTETVRPAASDDTNPPTPRKNGAASIASLLACVAVLLLMTQLLPDTTDSEYVTESLARQDSTSGHRKGKPAELVLVENARSRTDRGRDADRRLASEEALDDASAGVGLVSGGGASQVEQALNLPTDTQIVEITCSNIPQAVAEMQRLLSSNDIPGGKQLNPDVEAVLSEKKNAKRADALTAVFVQTSTAQTNTVLAALRKNKQFTSVVRIGPPQLKYQSYAAFGRSLAVRGTLGDSAPPVAFDALRPKSLLAKNSDKRGSVKKSDPQATTTKLKTSRLPARQLRKNESARKRPQTKQAKPDSTSYQLLVRLSKAPSASRRGKAIEDDRTPKADALKHGNQQPTRRILFVFRQQSPTEPAAARDAKKK